MSIDAIMFHNLAWFAMLAIVGVIGGAVWAWSPRVFIVISFVFGVYFIVLVWHALATDAFADARPFYYYIGCVAAGMTWDMWFNIGERIYTEQFTGDQL